MFPSDTASLAMNCKPTWGNRMWESILKKKNGNSKTFLNVQWKKENFKSSPEVTWEWVFYDYPITLYFMFFFRTPLLPGMLIVRQYINIYVLVWLSLRLQYLLARPCLSWTRDPESLICSCPYSVVFLWTFSRVFFISLGDRIIHLYRDNCKRFFHKHILLSI